MSHFPPRFSQPAHRDLLAVLDVVEDTAKARAGATPDPHNAVLWQQAAHASVAMRPIMVTPGPLSVPRSRLRPSPRCKPLTPAVRPFQCRRP